MKKKIYWGTFAIVVLLGTANLIEYQREYGWIRARATEIVGSAETPGEQVLLLRDYVRQHVSWQGAPDVDRPFLRSSAKEILESGKGYCGESTRVFVCLARSLGIDAQRLNLYARMNHSHVLAEVRLAPNRQIVVDPQINQFNQGMDSRPRAVLELLADPQTEFNDYSTIHIRRIPFLGRVIQRIKLKQTWFSWILENPPLLRAIVWGFLAVFLIVLYAADRVLLRVYARRLGLRKRTVVVSTPPLPVLKPQFSAPLG